MKKKKKGELPKNFRIDADGAIRLYEGVRYMLMPYRSNSFNYSIRNNTREFRPDLVGGFCKLILAKNGLLTEELSALIKEHKNDELSDMFFDECGFQRNGTAYIDVWSEYAQRSVFESAGILMTEIYGPWRFAEEMIHGVTNGEQDILRVCDSIDEQYSQLPPVLEKKDISEEDEYFYDEFDPYEKNSFESYYGLSDGESLVYAKEFSDDIRGFLSGKIPYDNVDVSHLSGFYDCVRVLMPGFGSRKKEFVEKLPGLLFLFFGGSNVTFRSRLNFTTRPGRVYMKNRNRLFVDDTDNGRIDVVNMPCTTGGGACAALSYRYIKGEYGKLYQKVSNMPPDMEDKEIEAFLWACECLCVNRYYSNEALMSLPDAFVDDEGDLMFSSLYPEYTDGAPGGIEDVGPSIAEIFAPLILVSVGDSLIKRGVAV